MKKNYFVALVAIHSLKAFAGTISGGGGALAKYERNPWFIDNTSKVHYCIVQDTESFHLDPAVARRSIAEAFSAWKYYFSTWQRELPQENAKFKVATQFFIHQDQCDEQTDIRFQLGTISPSQRKLLTTPSDWAGVAVLEGYDTKNLRARGFIYFGADSGSDQMRSILPIGEDPWQPCNGLPFKYVVMHELGHVFGLQHREYSWLMREDGPRKVVGRDYVNALRQDVNDNICKGERDILSRDRPYIRNLMGHSAFHFIDNSLFPRGFTASSDSVSSGLKRLSFRVHNGGFIEASGTPIFGNAITVLLPNDHPDAKNGYLWGAYPEIIGGQWSGSLFKRENEYWPISISVSASPATATFNFSLFDKNTWRLYDGKIFSTQLK